LLTGYITLLDEMKIAIHFSNREYPFSYAYRWINKAKEMNIDILCTDFKQTNIIEKLDDCDGAMWHWTHFPDDKQAAPKILDAIESGLIIPVFPNRETRWHYDEKISQYYFFDAIKAPKIRSWIFWNMKEALEFAEAAEYPLIFKLSTGAGSANVLKINNKDEAFKITELMFGPGFRPYTINEFEEKKIIYHSASNQQVQNDNNNLRNERMIKNIPILGFQWYYLIQKNYVYFQEFLPDNKFDIRITVIGNRAFGFIRYNRSNDFRASGSGKIDYNLNKIPLDAIKIAHRISMQNSFQSMAYDFLYDKSGKLVISEISYCFQNLAVYNCPGYWNRELKWCEGHFWPEEVQINDFIHYVKNGVLI